MPTEEKEKKTPVPITRKRNKVTNTCKSVPRRTGRNRSGMFGILLLENALSSGHELGKFRVEIATISRHDAATAAACFGRYRVWAADGNEVGLILSWQTVVCHYLKPNPYASSGQHQLAAAWLVRSLAVVWLENKFENMRREKSYLLFPVIAWNNFRPDFRF